MRHILVAIFTLCLVSTSYAESIYTHLKISKIKKIIVLKYETMDTKKTPKSSYVIQDKETLDKIKVLLSKVNADGSVWKKFPKTTPITKLYILEENGKYHELELYGKSIRSLVSKKGSFGLGEGEKELVKILLKENEKEEKNKFN